MKSLDQVLYGQAEADGQGRFLDHVTRLGREDMCPKKSPCIFFCYQLNQAPGITSGEGARYAI